MSKPPYYVFTASWPGPNSCGMSFSVHENGTLKAMADSWKYIDVSGVHGLALGERGGKQLIYSADLNGDLVWTHAVSDDGKVTEVGRLKMEKAEMHPRHLAAHPNGKYLYVLMEKINAIHQFDLDDVTGVAVKDAQSHSLIPEGTSAQAIYLSPLPNACTGFAKEDYWSAGVMLSKSGRYLWATARAQNNTDNYGYISAFLLSESGAIVKKMFMVPTTTVGGIANAISPAFWSDEYAAMTDVPTGYVEMFKMEGRKETVDGVEYATARPVAKVTIGDKGCCANVIWYS
jgi:carboxy-cis,cis-muconate cyclase